MSQVERYPLCVHARDRRGNTLCHYAVTKEDDRLLGVLLGAQLPKFWFPTNHDGVDILELSIQLKARSVVCCVVPLMCAGCASRSSLTS